MDGTTPESVLQALLIILGLHYKFAKAGAVTISASVYAAAIDADNSLADGLVAQIGAHND